MSAIRQNYSEACEAAINKQINMELYASYVYQSMVSVSMLLDFRFQFSDSFTSNFFKNSS